MALVAPTENVALVAPTERVAKVHARLRPHLKDIELGLRHLSANPQAFGAALAIMRELARVEADQMRSAKVRCSREAERILRRLSRAGDGGSEIYLTINSALLCVSRDRFAPTYSAGRSLGPSPWPEGDGPGIAADCRHTPIQSSELDEGEMKCD